MLMRVIGSVPHAFIGSGAPCTTVPSGSLVMTPQTPQPPVPRAAVPIGSLGMTPQTPQPPVLRGSLGEGELQPGAEVLLRHKKFRILERLGRGSFSTVWTAVRLDGGGEVAIKETLCHSQQDLQDAESECKLLQMVGNAALRAPGFVACETLRLHSGVISVRLAMAKLPGEMIDVFLQKWRGVGDPVSELIEAYNFAYELLLQLVPTFDAVSQVVLHRDINAHNLLVSTGGSSSIPQFSIIDFGLAVDMQTWQQDPTQFPVAGDCRYWPVSAWYIFAYGNPELIKMQTLFMEYRTQMDMHAFGITALQVFIGMLPRQTSQAVAAIPVEIWALKVAWDQYWQDASRLHEPVFKAPDLHTLIQLRHSFVASEAHNIIDRDLGQLRRALFAARDAFARVEPGSKSVMLFSALAELISQGAKPLGREAGRSSIKLASWKDIAGLLTSTSAESIGCEPVSRKASTTLLGRSPTSTTLPYRQVHRQRSTSASPTVKRQRNTSTTSPSCVPGTTTRFAPGTTTPPHAPAATAPSYIPAQCTRIPPKKAERGSIVNVPIGVILPNMAMPATYSPSYAPVIHWP